MSLEAGASLTFEMVDSTERFDSLEREWRELYAQSVYATAPLRWEWMNEWWKIFGSIYGAAPGGLRICTVRENGALIALLPLYLRAGKFLSQTVLYSLSTGEDRIEQTYPEYLGLLCRSGYEEAALRLIASEIFSQRVGTWDEFSLGLVGKGSGVANWITAPPRTPGVFLRVEDRIAPYADLSGGFEAYLGRLSGNSRQQYRRLLRGFDRSGLPFSLAQTADEAREYLAQLIELHQQRWIANGALGAFHSPRTSEFHHRCAQRFISRGEAALARLGTADRPLALIYGFLTPGRFDFYQSGVALNDAPSGAEAEIKRPGILAHLLMMRELAGRGVTAYDFLEGQSDYKSKLSTDNVTLHEIHFVRTTVRSILRVAKSRFSATIEKVGAGKPSTF